MKLKTKSSLSIQHLEQAPDINGSTYIIATIHTCLYVISKYDHFVFIMSFKSSEKHDACIQGKKQAVVKAFYIRCHYSNQYLGSFISSIFGPDSYSFQFTTHANDCSTNFITIIELFTNHCQQLNKKHVTRYNMEAIIRLTVQSKFIVYQKILTVCSHSVSDFPLPQLMVHLPPLAQIGSSHLGSILFLKQWKSAPAANLLGWGILL